MSIPFCKFLYVIKPPAFCKRLIYLILGDTIAEDFIISDRITVLTN